MNIISLQKVTYDSYRPSGSGSSSLSQRCLPGSSRISINGALYHKSSEETLQSHQGSISNCSVHNFTAAIDEDPLELSGQDPSISDHKSLHSLLKTTFEFRNQSLSTVCSIRDPESNRGSTATSTLRHSLSLSSLNDKAEFSLRPSLASPSSSPVYAVLTSPPLDDGGSQLPSIIEITPSIRPADFLSRPHRMGTTSHSGPDDLVTLKTTPPAEEVHAVTRVRALHSFEPTEPNELAFEKGDTIKVVNQEYKDWWRGQLKGRTGIFPVNYVEALPEPTSAELAAEAQQEASVFSQAANVDRLLTMLRTLDPAKDNLADNEEIQELYRSCMSLCPKIVKLIDKYSQKRADLVSMNENFIRARILFDRMMEESLPHECQFYEQQRPPFPQAQSTYPGAESRVHGQQPPGYGRPADQPQPYAWNPSVFDQAGYGMYPNAVAAYTQPQPYAWNPSVYDQAGYGMYPNAVAAYTQPRQGGPIADPLGRIASYAAGQLQTQPQPQVQPPSPHAQQAPQPQPQTAYAPPYPAQDNPRAAYYPQAQPQQAEAPPLPEQTQTPGQPQNQQQPQVQLQPQLQSQHTQQQPQVQSQPQLRPVQTQISIQTQPQAQTQSVPQQQHQAQAQASHSPIETHASVQPQSQVQKQQTLTDPPFVFDPTASYPDQNVQAWAQYYAEGGTDPTGSVYFISVPGITDAPTSAEPPEQTQTTTQQQPEVQSQPVETHTPVQPQPQVQMQLTMTGPPFVFDTTATYPDQNVQAWAQYYAEGGTDPTGSVYFISVPGITDGRSSLTVAVQPRAEGQQQQQQQATSATSFSGSAVQN